MYIVTFYSYKGGVGRTLALANVATDLVRRGRRVLLVDFDLEAPGLDTFQLFKPQRPTQGIVEYVNDYLALHETPDVLEYSYEATLPQCAGNRIVNGELDKSNVHADEVSDTGRLYVMPAGRRDASYSKLLQNIDWGLLYAEHNGYLMFEDMKEQWKQSFNPDYVLIDSRTGHTDVGGICTRQLPNAVVLLFFPNDQNLIGLEGVVSDIRDEAKPPRNKRIFLPFRYV
jgi:MinD-like ATPase involved in chromosome partitioning or flagellar assembly